MERAIVRSPVGHIELVVDAGAVTRLAFLDGDGGRVEGGGGDPTSPPIGPEGASADLRRAIAALDAYFAGRLDALDDLAVASTGTPFQASVWSALRRVPAGTTVSYRQLAAAVDRPRAVRAVGQANGANRVAVIIPCHRVIASGGQLGGYAYGMARKRWLLDHERRHGGTA